MRRLARSRRAVTPVWIAATAAGLTGVVLILLSNFAGSMFPGGTMDPVVIGDLLIAIGIALGMVGGGVTNPYALTIAPLAVALVLIGGSFGWFGQGFRI